MSSALEILFPTWIPEAARSRITELCRLAIDDTELRVLHRLANYPSIKTDVWEKLPPEPKGLEEKIIEWAFLTYTIFRKLPQPYPKTKAKAKWHEWARRRAKQPRLLDPAYLSHLSYELWEETFKAKLAMDSYWPTLWGGDKSISPDQILSILDQLRVFFGRMNEDYQAIFVTLPNVKRWNAKAGQKFFTEFLSLKMRETYGSPLDSIVAALTEVAFDMRQGLAAETVRGCRRISGRENSKRKMR